jgi:hypothetical protein
MSRAQLPHRLFSSPLHPTITGTIPQCIWSLPNLTSLHLAGNSFTGKLFNGDDDEYQQSQVRRAVLWRA